MCIKRKVKLKSKPNQMAKIKILILLKMVVFFTVIMFSLNYPWCLTEWYSKGFSKVLPNSYFKSGGIKRNIYNFFANSMKY